MNCVLEILNVCKVELELCTVKLIFIDYSILIIMCDVIGNALMFEVTCII